MEEVIGAIQIRLDSSKAERGVLNTVSVALRDLATFPSVRVFLAAHQAACVLQGTQKQAVGGQPGRS